MSELESLVKETMQSVIAAPQAESKSHDESESDQLLDVTQVIEQLPISKELAGIVIAVRELYRTKLLTQDQLVSVLRQFYEYDTGAMLKPSQLQSLTQHKLVVECDARYATNIEAVRRRRELSDLSRLDKILDDKMKKTNE